MTPPQHPDKFGDIELLEAGALTVVHATGGLSLHVVEGGWCVHVGPFNRYLGCTAPTIADAVLHALTDHVDSHSGTIKNVTLRTARNAAESNEHWEGP